MRVFVVYGVPPVIAAGICGESLGAEELQRLEERLESEGCPEAAHMVAEATDYTRQHQCKAILAVGRG